MTKINFLIEELKKTGFPLEMEILNILNSGNWIARPNDYYYDYDLNIGREIDIRASLFPHEQASNFNAFPFLAIECKKSQTMAWVFFQAKQKFGISAC